MEPETGLQVVTANAFIHNQFDGVEKVFLAKRAHTKKFLPNVFELPGGHVEFEEDLISGLKREIREEFGMEIKVGDLFAAFTYFNDALKAHSFGLMYFATFIGPISNVKLDPNEHAEFGWFSESDCPRINSLNRVKDDPAIVVLAKGFALLKGGSPSFG